MRCRLLCFRSSLALVLIVSVAQAQTLPSAGSEDRGDRNFPWALALGQSALFLGIEHSFRFTQAKTRAELKGPFFGDYAASLRGVTGWGDGDSVATNYFAHPMQGAVAGFIQIQNDPTGKYLRIGGLAAYWKSRLKATAWSAAYSTMFEVGPLSEATLGNVGKKPGTNGYVDFVMTPTGGLGWILAEDALDRYFIEKKEDRSNSLAWKRFYRMAFNPTRSFANLLRLKKPWHRDGRPIGGPTFVTRGQLAAAPQ